MSKIYGLTNDYVKGRWGSIFIVSLVFTLITTVLTMLMSGRSIYNFFNYFQMLILSNNPDNIAMITPMILQNTSASSGIIFIIAMIREILNNSLDVELKRTYSLYDDINLESAFVKTKENFWRFALLSLVKTIIIGLVSFVVILVSIIMILVLSTIIVAIPEPQIFTVVIVFVLIIVTAIILMIIMINIDLGMSYTQYIMDSDKNIDVFEAVKQSFRETKGHKFNLFRAQIHYILIPLAIFVGLNLVAVFFAIVDISQLVLLMIILSAIIFFIQSIYYTPNRLVVKAVYYVETNPEALVDLFDSQFDQE